MAICTNRPAKHRDQVVALSFAPIRALLAELEGVGPELQRGLVRPLALEPGADLGIGGARQRVRPPSDHGSIRRRYPEDVADHLQRERCGQVADEVALAQVGRPIQGSAHDLAHARLERANHLRSERVEHAAAHLGVLGRVQAEQSRQVVDVVHQVHRRRAC
jgi:hypothetical protein